MGERLECQFSLIAGGLRIEELVDPVMHVRKKQIGEKTQAGARSGQNSYCGQRNTVEEQKRAPQRQQQPCLPNVGLEHQDQ